MILLETCAKRPRPRVPRQQVQLLATLSKSRETSGGETGKEFFFVSPQWDGLRPFDHAQWMNQPEAWECSESKTLFLHCARVGARPTQGSYGEGFIP